MSDNAPVVRPWKAWPQKTMRLRLVAWRGELDGALDGLGTRVGEKDPLDARMGPADELLGEHPRQQGAVHLDQVGQVRVQGVVQGTRDRGVPSPQGEHPEAGKEVEVPPAFGIP